MSTTYTPNYGFGKQENYADTFSMEVITNNFNMLDAILKNMSDSIVPGAVKIKGTATKYANLPADASEGDSYKVTYSDDNYADGTVYTYHNGTWVSLAKNSYLKAEINNIDRVELAKVIDGGAKNLFNMTASSGNIAGGGITVTVNADKSLTLNGTSQNTGVTNFHLGKISLPEGSYVLSGCTGGSNSTYFLRIIAAPSVTNTNGSQNFETEGMNDVYVDIVIGGGKTLDNVTFKPMICAKSAWNISQKYVPYCPTVSELYAIIQSSQ